MWAFILCAVTIVLSFILEDDNTMNNIPYTYLIGWSNYDTWYYGVRYAKNCHPDDLWTKYKTSSTYVADFVQLHGEPDVVQVRKTFYSGADAREWEEKVLRRMKVVESDRWLNKTNNRSFSPMYGAENPMQRPEVAKKHGLVIASDEWRSKRLAAASNPDIRAKTSGSNHYSKKPGYICKTIGEKNPMAMPDVRQRSKENLPSRKGEANARAVLTADVVITIRAELENLLPVKPKYGEAGPVIANIAYRYGITTASVNSIRFRRTWKHI